MKKLMFMAATLSALTFIGCSGKKEAKEDSATDSVKVTAKKKEDPAVARAKAIAEEAAKYAESIEKLDFSAALSQAQGVITERQVKDIVIKEKFKLVTSCKALEYTLKSLSVKMINDGLAEAQLNDDAIVRMKREQIADLDRKLRPLKDYNATAQADQLQQAIQGMALMMKMSAGNRPRIVD